MILSPRRGRPAAARFPAQAHVTMCSLLLGLGTERKMISGVRAHLAVGALGKGLAADADGRGALFRPVGASAPARVQA